jgi:hypothetical protein
MMAVQLRPDRTLGPRHDTFWEWCARDELRLQRCLACGRLTWPVAARCEVCGNDDFRWDRMSGIGKLVSWCTFDHDYFGGILPMPWDTIVVELAEGPLFLSNPIRFTCNNASPDLPVMVQFMTCRDRAGEFRLPVFAPQKPVPTAPPAT